MVFSPTENEQSLKGKMPRLTDSQITALFREPRTMRKFEDRSVSDDQLRQIQELTYLGPTAFNSQPLRITWIKSIEARERLVKHLIESNREKASKLQSMPYFHMINYGWSEQMSLILVRQNP